MSGQRRPNLTGRLRLLARATRSRLTRVGHFPRGALRDSIGPTAADAGAAGCGGVPVQAVCGDGAVQAPSVPLPVGGLRVSRTTSDNENPQPGDRGDRDGDVDDGFGLGCSDCSVGGR